MAPKPQRVGHRLIPPAPVPISTLDHLIELPAPIGPRHKVMTGVESSAAAAAHSGLARLIGKPTSAGRYEFRFTAVQFQQIAAGSIAIRPSKGLAFQTK